jgi:hypothetical protein
MSALRGVGYSLDAAVADLIDNSISAGASRITIIPRWVKEGPELTILDNGRGMSPEALVEAMRFGGRGTKASRATTDLGRFGLGLKTASLSQARKFTVISRVLSGEPHAACWDLDYVMAGDGRWELLRDLPVEVSAEELLPVGSSGTLVLWQNVDFGRANDVVSEATFRSELRNLENHLAMVFHRFLETGALEIRLGNISLRPWDPFLETHSPASDEIGRDVIRTAGGDIVVTGFVLPHRDRFRTQADHDKAGGPDGWHAHQGFHIYRGNRLVVPGGWLRLGHGRAWRRAETSKLARIRVEIPTTADFDWQIDVKKSVARPPATIRSRLESVAEDVRKHALDVHLHRGGRRRTPDSASATTRVWLRDENAEPRYQINRSHPAVAAVAESAGAGTVENLLRVVEATLPIAAIWLDASDGAETQPSIDPGLAENAFQFCVLLVKQGVPVEDAITRVSSSEPFCTIVGIAEHLSERMKTA